MRLPAFAALMLASAAASAQPYIWLTFSQAQIKANVGDGISDSGPAFSLGTGYRFGKRLAVEAGYFDLIRVHATAASQVQGSSRFTTTHYSKAQGFGVAAVGTWPVADRVSLLAKLGAHYLRHELRSQTVENEAAAPFRFIAARVNPETVEREWTPTIGLGAEVSLDEQIRLRAMLEHIAGRGELDRIRLLSLQAVYSF